MLISGAREHKTWENNSKPGSTHGNEGMPQVWALSCHSEALSCPILGETCMYSCSRDTGPSGEGCPGHCFSTTALRTRTVKSPGNCRMQEFVLGMQRPMFCLDHGWIAGCRIRIGPRNNVAACMGLCSVPRLVAEKQPSLGKFLYYSQKH